MACKIRGCVRSCDGTLNYSTIPHFSKTNTKVLDESVREIISSPYPIPYTFRVPAPSLQTCRRQNLPQTTRAPPFCLQLDHTLGVLWNLFRKKADKPGAENVELGIGQMQWALYFLKGVKPPNGGDRAEDVNIAIQAVEDALLDLYADMSDLVLQTPKEPLDFESLMPFKDNDSCTVCSEVRQYTRSMPVENWIPSTSVRHCGKCSSSTLGDSIPRRSGRKDTYPEKTTSKRNFKCGVDQCSIIKECGPGNLGSPWATTGKDTSENLLQNPELTQEILHLKSMASELNKRAPNPTDVSHITMLQEWRKEQMNRVEEELERLKNLDTALGVSSNADAALNSFRNGEPPQVDPHFLPPHSSTILKVGFVGLDNDYDDEDRHREK